MRFAAFASAPVRAQLQSRKHPVVVRAEAKANENAPQMKRRELLGAGLLAAAATTMPYIAPGSALANKVVSSDWELVSIAFHLWRSLPDNLSGYYLTLPCKCRWICLWTRVLCCWTLASLAATLTTVRK